MQLTILKWKNRLEKVHRICAEFTKMVCIIFNFWQNSENPNYLPLGPAHFCVYTAHIEKDVLLKAGGAGKLRISTYTNLQQISLLLFH